MSINRFRFTFFLILCLAMAPAKFGYAQLLQTQDWEKWNGVSTPIYPGKYWKQFETPEEAGWSSEKLGSAQRISNMAGSAAVVVVYDGAVLVQWGQIERRFMCHSIRKSLLSALYGIAVADGQIELSDTIGSIGINDDTELSEVEKSAKISDLIKSRSGVYLPAAYETPSMKKNRPERGSHEPGSHWYYNNWDFNALATIYNKEADGDLFQSFLAEIAIPLQMQDFELRHTYYHHEPENSRHPAYPFRMSARDLARFGLLFLDEGRWRNNQIIPSDWVRESTSAHSKDRDGGYGYMWWTLSGQLGDLGSYAAFGYGGHAIYVVPKAKLVFVHRTDTYEDRRVNHGSIRNILNQVLKARVGPPRVDPKLVTLDKTTSVFFGLDLSEVETSALVGDYQKDDFAVSVRELDGRLFIEGPHWGTFFLNPETPTEFTMEDEERRLEFELDDAGLASAIKIWFSADEPYEMARVR